MNIELVYSFFRIILDPLRLPLNQLEGILSGSKTHLLTYLLALDYIEKYNIDLDEVLVQN